MNDVMDELVGMGDWLVGSWRLLSCIERGSDGSILYPMGPDGIGQLIYDRAGRVSAQMMQQGQRRFADADLRHATDEEKAAAWGGYFGYFGIYTVDEAAQSVTRHVEGSSFPNLAGTDQVRYYRREGQRLILDADTAWGRVSAVWEKLGTP